MTTALGDHLAKKPGVALLPTLWAANQPHPDPVSFLGSLPQLPLTSLGKVMVTTRTLLVMRFSGRSDLEKSNHPESGLAKAKAPCAHQPPSQPRLHPCGAPLGDTEGSQSPGYYLGCRETLLRVEGEEGERKAEKRLNFLSSFL